MARIEYRLGSVIGGKRAVITNTCAIVALVPIQNDYNGRRPLEARRAARDRAAQIIADALNADGRDATPFTERN